MRLGIALLPVFLLTTFLLTGCGVGPLATPSLSRDSLNISGVVHGGATPIIGAHVYLLAVNTTGYGGNEIPASTLNASVSLLNAANTKYSDAVGAYVLTGAGGSFSLAGDFICPTPSAQVYLYALGGNTGAGNNSAAGLMAALGNCGSLSSATHVTMNEVTTIATAYALAGFATDATHISSSGTPLAQTGVANAFANAGNLVNLTSGTALANNAAGNVYFPSKMINSLGNILASCIDTSDATSGTLSGLSQSCATLLAIATSDGTPSGLPSADTASAAINIAHHPGSNVFALFSMQTPASPFAPVLPSMPNDFLVGIFITGGGLNRPNGIAIDAQGNAWISNQNSSGVSEISRTGAAVSPSTGFQLTSLLPSQLTSVAVDPSGNIWVASSQILGTQPGYIFKYSSTGIPISGSNGYQPPFSGQYLGSPISIAFDPFGNAWVANDTNGGFTNTVTEFSSNGTLISPPLGYSQGNVFGPQSLAIDASTNIWTANLYSVAEISSSGTLLSPSGSSLSSFSGGYHGGGLSYATNIAIDHSGNVWTPNIYEGGGSNSSSGVAELSSSGTPLSPPLGYTGGGLGLAQMLAIDGAGNVWVSNGGNLNFTEFSSTGTPLSPSTGYGTNTIVTADADAIAIDGSGDIWISDGVSFDIAEVIGAATPVVTPVVANLIAPYSAPASKP